MHDRSDWIVIFVGISVFSLAAAAYFLCGILAR